MELNNRDNELETNPYLPSGDWEGFYCYHHSPRQHKMASQLQFINNTVEGSGVDDIAPFTWIGLYSLKHFKTKISKLYTTHAVKYKGDIDENGIWGTWEIVYDYSKFPQQLVPQIKEAVKHDMTGGFHIWPRPENTESAKNSQSEVNESAKLSEIFIKVFS